MIRKITRSMVLTLICKYRIDCTSEKELINLLGYEAENLEAGVLDMVQNELKGCSNGFLSDFYKTLTGKKVEVIGEIQKLFACPCCGFQTLSEIYNIQQGTGYDICDYCSWEDDGTFEPNKTSSVNNGSINSYMMHIIENKNFFYKNKWLR